MNTALLQAAIEAEAAGDLNTAVGHYTQVLGADPRCVEALNNLGAIAFRVGHKDDALSFYRQALWHRPDFLPAQINLARTLASLNQVEEAHQTYAEANRHGAGLEGEHAQMLVNKGFPAQGQFIVQEACVAHPENPDLWLTLGNARLFQQSPEEAELCYRKACTLADTPRARANLAIALLAQGKFNEGWPLYENRYDPTLRAHDAVRFEALPWAQWQGQSLQGKRLLLVGEQGHGDQIHFVRFVAQLARMGASVDLLCKPNLVDLFARIPGLHACFATLSTDMVYDYWSPLLSLPLQLDCMDARLCETTPYLEAAPAKRSAWRDQLQAWRSGQQIAVGLVWSGAAGNSIDALRSIHLEELLPTLEGLGTEYLWVSLQAEPGDAVQQAQLTAAGIHDVSARLTDFDETAALIAELDLIISVDTAVLHLTGALNKPALGLLGGTDWRWGTPGQSQCALYPCVRPFWRDTQLGWQHALQALRAFLLRYAASSQ